jgi:glucans biosynthesis protein C
MEQGVNGAVIARVRRHDLDWLRVLAVLLLIPFHTARIFDHWEPFYAKNGELSWPLSYFIAFVSPWHMPLLFLLAGAATYFALQFRSGGVYLRERVFRLLVPFIFGLLVIVPPQTYLARLREPGYAGSYLEYYPSFFELGGDLSGYTGMFTPGHLWFILFLFVISLAALPLLLRFRKGGEGAAARLASLCERPGAVFLLAVPLAFAAALPDMGGKNIFLHFSLFVYGYLLVADARFRGILERHRGTSLLLGVLSTSAVMAIYMGDISFPKYSPGDIAFHFLRSFNMWFWVVALLGYGQRYLGFENRLLRYANEAAYPFYILHQTVIVAIGYYVVQWDLGVGAKFLVVSAVALVATTLLYDVVTKRTNPARFLFGMRPRLKTRSASQIR